MRRNESAHLEAIHNPDLGVRQHSASITVPEEFNLSVGSARGPARRPGAHAEPERRDWSGSLRQPSAPQSARESARAWGGLTVPEGPLLHTASRARSTSAEPRPPSERPAISRHHLPREQTAIEHHLERVTSARTPHEDAAQRPAAGRPPQALRPPPGVDLDHWARQGATAEERAQCARVAAQARHEQALAAEKDRLCVFQTRGPRSW